MNVSLVMVAANACGGFSGEHKACHIRKPWSMERGAFLILLSSVLRNVWLWCPGGWCERSEAWVSANSHLFVTLSDEQRRWYLCSLPADFCFQLIWNPGRSLDARVLGRRPVAREFLLYTFRVLPSMPSDIRSWRIKLTEIFVPKV